MADSTQKRGAHAPKRVSTRTATNARSTSRPAPARGAGSGAKKSATARSTGTKRRRRFSWWKTLLAMMFAGIALVAGVFVTAYITTEIPAPDDFAQAQTSQVLYADGSAMGEFSEYDRELVDMASLPDYVQHAVVASEDRRFYENPGVDFKGTIRALWNNLRGLPTQGGSTITQQYVERYYLGTTTSIPGKFEEAILALKISSELSKDEILGTYLNTIYFGRGAYGIEVAAQNYFGKPAAELTLSEAALIAGIIPAPSAWDPAIDPERAEQRWNRVLDLMVEDGWITAEERAAQVFPQAIEFTPNDTYAGPNGYILSMVRTELANQAGITEAEVDTAGLTITTTIDPRLQQAALDAMATVPTEGRAPNTRMGLVSMDPTNGAVRAVYGGPDYLTVSRNAVTQDRAQMGSTAKIFGLINALENGASLADRYASYDDMVIEGYDFPVSNFDSRDRGRINLVDATLDSVNTVYVQMNRDYGPDGTREAMIRAGLPETTPGLDPVLSNVLGPATVTPWEMVTAYGTIASGGVKHTPHVVQEVVDADGNLRYQAPDTAEQVFDQEVMGDVTYAMNAVVDRGTGVEARLPDRDAAGKTGSSNGYRSAWFAGFIPQLVTVVDIYQPGPNGEEEVITPFGGFQQISGGSIPAMTWYEYMVRATEGMEVLPLAMSENPFSRPGSDAPTQEPVTEAPVTEAPVTGEPTTEEPTSEEPTTEAPTTEAPTAEPPTTAPPTTAPPTTAPPSTQPPAPSPVPTTTQPPVVEPEPTTVAPQPTTQPPGNGNPPVEPPGQSG